MDDYFKTGNLSSFSSNTSFSNGGNGNVKRTSTSTTFINGKKIMTTR